MILVGIAGLILSPVILTILLICILMSRHIFANLVYFTIYSIITFNAILRETNDTLRQYFYIILGLHLIFTIIRIGLLCIYRRTRTFHRLSLSVMINTLHISLLYTIQSHDDLYINNPSLTTICNYCYTIIIILFLSEFWIRSGPKRLEQIEDKLLKLVIYKNQHKNQSLEKYKDIDSTLKIERKYHGNLSYLHCYTKSSKHKLVLVHGYVVGKCVFSISIRWLARYFDVYILDAPGNGLSKPVWLPWIYPSWSNNIDYIEKWTADQIEKWRLSVFDAKQKIYLVGHSTGSYMVSAYALHYPQNLDYLILCSPVCLLTKEEYMKKSGILKIDLKAYGFGAIVLSEYLWNYFTWPDIVRALGLFGPLVFINVLKQTQKHHAKYGDMDQNLFGEMSDLWFRYTYDLHAQPKSYEDLLFAYMKPWCWPRKALLKRLKQKLDCNLLMIFADKEQSFCDKLGGKLLIQELEDREDWKYKADMEIIKDSTHMIFLNQPVRCCKAILKYTHGIDLSQDEIATSAES